MTSVCCIGAYHARLHGLWLPPSWLFAGGASCDPLSVPYLRHSIMKNALNAFTAYLTVMESLFSDTNSMASKIIISTEQEAVARSQLPMSNAKQDVSGHEALPASDIGLPSTTSTSGP